MRIKMKTTAAGPHGVHHSGAEYDIEAKLANAYLKGGYAEKVETKKDNPPADDPDEDDNPPAE